MEGGSHAQRAARGGATAALGARHGGGAPVLEAAPGRPQKEEKHGRQQDVCQQRQGRVAQVLEDVEHDGGCAQHCARLLRALPQRQVHQGWGQDGWRVSVRSAEHQVEVKRRARAGLGCCRHSCAKSSPLTRRHRATPLRMLLLRTPTHRPGSTASRSEVQSSSRESGLETVQLLRSGATSSLCAPQNARRCACPLRSVCATTAPSTAAHARGEASAGNASCSSRGSRAAGRGRPGVGAAGRHVRLCRGRQCVSQPGGGDGPGRTPGVCVRWSLTQCRASRGLLTRRPSPAPRAIGTPRWTRRAWFSSWLGRRSRQ